jgi:putative CocE/NonD family hydrolase
LLRAERRPLSHARQDPKAASTKKSLAARGAPSSSGPTIRWTTRHGFVVERDVTIRARDGVALASDVYRPSRGAFPALLERTPYDKRRPALEEAGRFFAVRGYVFVSQDVRGRHGSEGEWYFLQEREGPDGYDTIAWIAAQPWCNGRVGTLGLSYSTATQQALAVLRPPGLLAQYLSDGGYSYFHRTLRSGGAFELGVLLPYAIRMAREGQRLARDAAARGAFERELAGLRPWLERLPLRRGESFLRHAPEEERWFFDMLENETYAPYWRQPTLSMAEHVERYPDVPVACQTSWYGHHVWATVEKWRALRERGRAPKRLLIGPWLHGYDEYARSFAGEVDFGTDAAIDLLEERLRFFDAFAKGGGQVDEVAPVRVFVMGGGSGLRNGAGRLDHGGRWRSAADWPLPGTESVRLFLHEGGMLAAAPPPPGSAPSRYRHDPGDPVPAIGGHVQNPAFPGFVQGGAFDQRGRAELWACRDARPLRARADVLVFETEPLPADREVVGPIEVKLWVASEATDADVVVKLLDVYPPSDGCPEGFAMNLTEAILRLRFRNGFEAPQALVAGEVYAIALEPQPTANLFKAGHRIRLDVQGSHFPQFDVNPQPGTVAVFHDALRPSHVVLPLAASR